MRSRSSSTAVRPASGRRSKLGSVESRAATQHSRPQGARFRDPCRRSCLIHQGPGAQQRPVLPPLGRGRDPPRRPHLEAAASRQRGRGCAPRPLQSSLGAELLPPLPRRADGETVARRAVSRGGLVERGALVGTLVGGDGQEIVALASYARLRDPASAEVACFRRRCQQGRGIGTRMLEQLAERAAAVGIERFVVDVMGENAAMMRVFEDAGFGVSRALDRGTFVAGYRGAPPADTASLTDLIHRLSKLGEDPARGGRARPQSGARRPPTAASWSTRECASAAVPRPPRQDLMTVRPRRAAVRKRRGCSGLRTP